MNTFKITVLLLAYFSIGDVKSQDLSFCNTASIGLIYFNIQK